MKAKRLLTRNAAFDKFCQTQMHSQPRLWERSLKPDVQASMITFAEQHTPLGAKRPFTSVRHGTVHCHFRTVYETAGKDIFLQSKKKKKLKNLKNVITTKTRRLMCIHREK